MKRAETDRKSNIRVFFGGNDELELTWMEDTFIPAKLFRCVPRIW